MSEQSDAPDERAERAARLHEMSHEIVRLINAAAPNIEEIHKILYDCGESETDYKTKLSAFQLAGHALAAASLLNELAQIAHSPETWGFGGNVDVVVVDLTDMLKRMGPQGGGSHGGRLN